MHEELELLGENRDDLRYELRFSDMFAMDLAPNYDPAHERSAFVQIDLPGASDFQSERCRARRRPASGSTTNCRIDADEATWRGICDAAQRRGPNLRVSVWASFSGGDQKDAKLGGVRDAAHVKIAIGTEVTVSLNLTRSKKKRPPKRPVAQTMRSSSSEAVPSPKRRRRPTRCPLIRRCSSARRMGTG